VLIHDDPLYLPKGVGADALQRPVYGEDKTLASGEKFLVRGTRAYLSLY
jgi:hypothetical protein